jgi:hypothetical protein
VLNQKTFNGKHSENNANDEEKEKTDTDASIESILPTPKETEQEKDNSSDAKIGGEPDHMSSLV